VVTLVGLQFGYLLGGTIVIEEIFSLPGMGRLVLRSIAQRDFPLVQGILLVGGAGVVLLNLCVDVCYVLLDPRLRRR
jgi:peptide/nickel transport system permease protein